MSVHESEAARPSSDEAAGVTGGPGELEPSPEELSLLSPLERFAFLTARRMNAGGWKRFWTACQRTVGAGWIHLATYNIMRVSGLEHLGAVSPARPILLVANHRSFFDLYAVSTVLFRRTDWGLRLFFPVRGRFFYDSIGGLVVNCLMGWWSMYPPFFGGGERPKVGKREFDKLSMRLLTDLCRQGAGNVVGFHPEGMRNKSDDPYALLRPQPGVGKLIKDARPQVLPVFVAGLGNDLASQVLGNWRGGEAVRVRFGAPLDFGEFYQRRDSVRTYKEIADHVMSKIAELAAEDRAEFGRAVSDKDLGLSPPAPDAGPRAGAEEDERAGAVR